MTETTEQPIDPIDAPEEAFEVLLATYLPPQVPLHEKKLEELRARLAEGPIPGEIGRPKQDDHEPLHMFLPRYLATNPTNVGFEVISIRTEDGKAPFEVEGEIQQLPTQFVYGMIRPAGPQKDLFKLIIAGPKTNYRYGCRSTQDPKTGLKDTVHCWDILPKGL